GEPAGYANALGLVACRMTPAERRVAAAMIREGRYRLAGTDVGRKRLSQVTTLLLRHLSQAGKRPTVAIETKCQVAQRKDVRQALHLQAVVDRQAPCLVDVDPKALAQGRGLHARRPNDEPDWRVLPIDPK